jgi:methionyl aminopeptidase
MYVSLYTDVPVSNAVLGRNLRLRTRAKYASSRDLTSGLRDNFGTLVFCRRYLERLGAQRYLAGVSLPAWEFEHLLTYPDELTNIKGDRSTV